MLSNARIRVISVLVYGLVLIVIQREIVSTGLTPNQNAIWLYNGIANLLFGSRLLYPYFTPPADAATNAFATLTSLIAATLVVQRSTVDYYLILGSSIVIAALLFAACVVLVARPT